MNTDHGVEYWQGFGAALDAVKFGVRFGLSYEAAVERATESAVERLYYFHVVCAAKKGAVELERPHALAPRRWRLSNGEILGEAVNPDAIELLKRDPDEYFRRIRRARKW